MLVVISLSACIADSFLTFINTLTHHKMILTLYEQ
jgi:hypothetical protein